LFISFPFGDCIVCNFLIYVIWLPLWYFQTLLSCIAKPFFFYQLSISCQFVLEDFFFISLVLHGSLVVGFLNKNGLLFHVISGIKNQTLWYFLKLFIIALAKDITLPVLIYNSLCLIVIGKEGRRYHKVT
jgi:hypothetical protein